MAPPSPAKRGVTVGKRGKSAPKKKEIIISRDDAGGVLVSGSTFPIKDHLKEHGGVWVPEQTCWKFEDASVESVTAAVRECTDEEFVIKTDAGGSTLTPHPPAKRTASSSKKPSEFALADMTLAEKKQMDAQRKWKRVKISEDGDEIL